MLRNMVRRGIRAVQNRADPGPSGGPKGGVIATFAHDRIVSGIQLLETPEADAQLLREVARRVVEEMVRG
jgi:hypothetical protein